MPRSSKFECVIFGDVWFDSVHGQGKARSGKHDVDVAGYVERPSKVRGTASKRCRQGQQDLTLFLTFLLL